MPGAAEQLWREGGQSTGTNLSLTFTSSKKARSPSWHWSGLHAGAQLLSGRGCSAKCCLCGTQPGPLPGLQEQLSPFLPLPVPPWMSLQPFQTSQAELDPNAALALPAPGAPLGGLPPCPAGSGLSLLPASPALELLQALRLALATLCRGRDSGSKFSLMNDCTFCFELCCQQ